LRVATAIGGGRSWMYKRRHNPPVQGRDLKVGAWRYRGLEGFQGLRAVLIHSCDSFSFVFFSTGKQISRFYFLKYFFVSACNFSRQKFVISYVFFFKWWNCINDEIQVVKIQRNVHHSPIM
jgi:hypothetical protein